MRRGFIVMNLVWSNDLVSMGVSIVYAWMAIGRVYHLSGSTVRPHILALLYTVAIGGIMGLLSSVLVGLWYSVGRKLLKMDDHLVRCHNGKVAKNEVKKDMKSQGTTATVILIAIGAIGIVTKPLSIGCVFGASAVVTTVIDVGNVTIDNLDVLRDIDHYSLICAVCTIISLVCTLISTLLGHVWAVQRNECYEEVLVKYAPTVASEIA